MEKMNYLEKARALREDGRVHYNCCQAVLIPFCEACGLDEEAAGRLGAHFGGGMRHGGTCGAVTGALMVLGMTGKDERAARALMNGVRERHGALDCAHLLAGAKETGVERTCHCNGMVYEAVELVERLLEEE